MATHIVDTTVTTISPCGAIFIQNNLALTGTITISAGGIVQGIITNPIAGNTFRYGNLSKQNPITITSSGVCDISVTAMSRLVG